MKRYVWLVVCGLAAFALTASAAKEDGKAKGGGERGAAFRTADADGDGKLSATEFATVCKKGKPEKKFAAADTDKDGFLTKDELKAAHRGGGCDKGGGKKGDKPTA